MTLSPVAAVGGIGMLLVALGFVAYALVRRLGWKYLLLGMLGWFVTVAVKVAIAVPASQPVINAAKGLAEPWSTLALLFYGGLMTGLTEVAIVWVVLRYTRLGQVAWPGALAFGIGFGAIEAFLLGAASLTAALFGIFAPDQMPQTVMKELANADRLIVQLVPIWERFFTCLGHIGTNTMIFYAVVQKRVRWFWWALAYKSAIDGIATVALVRGLLTSAGRTWMFEGIAAVWGIIGLAITLWIGRRYPAAPTEGDTPDAAPPQGP